VVEDSAGTAIVVTAGDSAFALLDWSVSPAPDLVLGDRPDPDEQFHRIGGVAALPDGGVAVLDGGSNELRFYDVAGNLVTRTGRTGSGAGEFRNPSLVASPSADSILIHDLALRRMTAYSTDGRRLGEAAWSQRGRAPVGLLDGRALLQRQPVMRVEDMQRSGVQTYEPTYLWFDSASGDEIPLRSWSIDRGFTYPPGPDQAYPSMRTIPFTVMPSALVTVQAAMLTSGSAFEILEFDVAGNLKRAVRVDSPRRPVTGDEIDGLIDLELSRSSSSTSRSSHARALGEMPLPDSMPAFVSLHVDDVGWIWAQLYDWDTRLPTRWMVFAPDGRARGTVSTPAGLKVHHIGERFVLGVWVDEYGVEYVRRYALDRRGAV
jgi:hypothetical protein